MKAEGPRVCVLKTDGTNCDVETSYAFGIAGAQPKTVHVNELRTHEDDLRHYQILALPGGFSYGDDIASGKILALELTTYLADQINDFINKQGLVLGICNGFQVLVRTGLLPFGTMGQMQTTLSNNRVGPFDCRPVNLKVEEGNACAFLNGMDEVVTFPVAHGEGRFYAKPPELQRIEGEKLVVFRYCDQNGNLAYERPQNPNGSLNAIAGICDPSGHILGLMPHPERAVKVTQHPNWRRLPNLEPQGLPLFRSMINYTAQSR